MDINVLDSSLVPGIPLNVVDSKAKRGKQGVREVLKLTQMSTASMGRFDEMRKGEPAKKMKPVKRSFRDNVSNKDLASEKVAAASHKLHCLISNTLLSNRFL